MVDILAAHLRGEGYGVSGALTGDEGLKNFILARPDLVLLDIRFTGEMNGIELLGKLRWRHLTQKLNEVEREIRIERKIARSTAADRFWNINALAAEKYRPGSYTGSLVWFEAGDLQV